MLLDDPFQGSVTGTHYSLFKKYNSKIPTFTPSLLNQNIESLNTICRLQENKVLQKTATTGRQPVKLHSANKCAFVRANSCVLQKMSKSNRETIPLSRKVSIL